MRRPVARSLRVLAAIAAITAVSLVATASAGAKLYFMNGSEDTIGVANQTGQVTNAHFIPVGRTIGPCCTHQVGGYGLATDGPHIFWTNNDGDQANSSSLGRATLDATGAVIEADTTQTLIALPDYAYGMALSLQPDGTSFIYWAHGSTAGDSIGQVQMDAGGEVIPGSLNANFITGADDPRYIAVDGDDIYWSNQATDSIGHARVDATGALDGTPDPQAVPSGDMPSDPNQEPNVKNPTGVAVAGGYLYWVDHKWKYPDTYMHEGDGHEIGRVALDGDGLPTGSVENKFITGMGSSQQAFTGTQTANGLASDGTYLYWANGGIPFYSDKDDDIGRAPIADPMGAGFSYSWVRTTYTSGLVALRDASVHADCPNTNPVTTCTVTVSDPALAAGEVPLGKVIFSASGHGTFDPADAECILSPASATSSTCVIDYTRSGTGGELISMQYAGSPLFSSSSGTTTLLPVPVDTPPDNGTPILPLGPGPKPQPPKHKKAKCKKKKKKKGKKKALAAKKKCKKKPKSRH